MFDDQIEDWDSVDPILTDFQNQPSKILTKDVINICTTGSCSVVTTESAFATFVLPWWKTVPSSTGFGCNEEGEINYNPYQIFCLNTRISPFCQNLMGSDCIVTFLSTLSGHKMELVLVLNRYSPPEFASDSNPNIESSFNTMTVTPEQRRLIQNKIDEILIQNPEACLIMPFDSEVKTIKGDSIPKWWIKQILPFVTLNSAYRPFCDSDGFHVILSDWDDSEPNSEVLIQEPYDQKYIRLLQNITAQLRKMYNDGYVITYSRDKTILKSWGLIPMDDDGVLYKPNWKNPRMVPNIVEFVLARIRQDPYFFVPIASEEATENELAVYHHFIAQEFVKRGVGFRFIGFMVELSTTTVGSIVELQSLWSSIQEVKTKSDMAGLLTVEKISGPTTPLDSSCIGYQTFDLFQPNVLSCLTLA